MASREYFAGKVMVYGDEVFINTRDGTGFVEVLEMMSGFLDKFSRRRSHEDTSVEDCDIRQDARLAAIEGILAYRPRDGARLSTFLHGHVRNRMIDSGRKRRVQCIPFEEGADALLTRGIAPEDRIAVMRVVESWSPRWRRIMFRILVKQDRVKDVAMDEGMSAWGLTRAAKKRIERAREMI